jgi:hypothetical protein
LIASAPTHYARCRIGVDFAAMILAAPMALA